jgi:nicotinamidase-related amidase
MRRGLACTGERDTAGAAMETPAPRAMVPKLAEALKLCRGVTIPVIYTVDVHRRDGCDMG